MLFLQIIAVLVTAQVVVMAISVKEQSLNHRKFLIKKRAALELLENENSDKPASFVFSVANLTKSHHYWTRKRGRPTQDPDYYYYQSGFRTTRRSLSPTPRQKRNTPESSESSSDTEHPDVGNPPTESTRSSLQASTGQAAIIEANLNDPNVVATDRTTEGPIHLGPRPHDRNRHRESRKRFGSKQNNCCAEEADFVGFNETLASIKSQCLVETRKNRKVNNASSDFVEGDGSLYTMFSYERVSFHKTVVICTISCVAQKVGMIDDKGEVDVQVAKKLVKSNFAQEKWEQAASDQSVDKCIDEINTSDRSPVNAFGFECSSKAAEFVFCMWREFFLTCPNDKQRRTQSCEKLRNVLSTSKVNKFRN